METSNLARPDEWGAGKELGHSQATELSGEVGTMGLGLRKAWLRVTGMLVAHLGKGLP